ACNNDEYLRLPREDVTQMMNKRGLIPEPELRLDVCSGAQIDPQVVSNRCRPSDGPAFTPNCRWAPRTALDPRSFRLGGGAEVQLETVPPGLLPRIPEYFICTGCGKVFWEGTHFDRVLAQFQDILNLSDDDVTSRKP
ncbi:exonuclease mut-7 homolog, partial [Tachysurus ichikawai]